MQCHDSFQIIGQMGAVFGLAPGHAVFGQVGMGQVIDARQQRAEMAAVVHDPTDRDAAEAHAVIAALAPDQARPGAVAAGAVIGKRNLQRRINGFRARVAIKYMLHPSGGDVHDAIGQLESQWMAHLKGRGIVQLADLGLHGLGDLRATMAGIAAPQARRAVEDLPTIGRGIMHVLRRDQHPRRRLELTVRGEGHPKGAQVIRGGLAIKRHG